MMSVSHIRLLYKPQQDDNLDYTEIYLSRTVASINTVENTS